MRVIVCGGRNYSDVSRVWNFLNEIDFGTSQITAVAHGGATGVDDIAGRWARARGKLVCVFRARWLEEGKAAGPLRNQRMIDQFAPDAVIAFEGGRGTADMVRRATERGVEVIKAWAPGENAWNSEGPDEEVAANARLIAAAPDLLEALKEINGIVEHAQQIVGATLPSDGMSEKDAIAELLLLLDGPDQRRIQGASRAAIAKAEAL